MSGCFGENGCARWGWEATGIHFLSGSIFFLDIIFSFFFVGLEYDCG